MKAEIKTEWVAALRSGEYTQGQGWLKSADGRYCCLGVLCTLLGFPTTENRDQELSKDELETVGLDKTAQVELITRNDGHSRTKQTFLQIADYIEANL